MMRKDCPICRGAGTIHFSIVAPMPVGRETLKVTDAGFVDARTYPCPECSVVPTVRLLEQSINILLAAEIMTPKSSFETAVKQQLVAQMAQKIVSDGLITFETVNEDTTTTSKTMTARLWLVDPRGTDINVALHSHAVAVSKAAAAVAVHDLLREVNNWGSHYHHETISKAKVNDLADEVLKRIRSST